MAPKVDTSGGKAHDEGVDIALLMELKATGQTLKTSTLDTIQTSSTPSFSRKRTKGETLGPEDVGRSVGGSGGEGRAAANTPKKRKAGAGGEDRGSAKKKRAPAKKRAKQVDSGVDDDDREAVAGLKVKPEQD